ncbi:putative bifunctional diguanylate cyclase/phosphodiesterase [Sutterella sp.]|uniref:putative bifunctional diguanylate cyclase/phosphodiesterase n=1 Tax=Sutterella sp. TaxID=1981025 RepID=UPI003FD8A56F
MYANNTTLNSGQFSGRRSWFVEKVQARLAEGVHDFAIVSIDVCEFKVINLIFGSDAGDRMLGNIYNAILACLGNDEVVVRDTADIFYALFHSTDKQAILNRLAQIRRNLDALVFADEAYSPYLETRFGVYMPTDNEESVEQMLECANMARKHSGRELLLSDACFYNLDRAFERLQEKERISHLSEALGKHQFVVYLQPKVSLTTEKIIGAEALVRWNRPDVGIVSPGEFIPLLERYRLVHHVDVFVFEKVCRMLAEWKSRSMPILPISLNLSRQTIEIPDLLSHLQSVCKSLDVDPSLIELEITETLAVKSYDKVRKFIDQLKNFGFKCSIDDFGFGYSSLGCLSELKVDSVKLDRSFFVNHDCNKAGIIVKAVTDLAAMLEYHTVAEGIETEEQLAALKQTNCNTVQGFYFFRPMSVEDFEHQVESESNAVKAVKD